MKSIFNFFEKVLILFAILSLIFVFTIQYFYYNDTMLTTILDKDQRLIPFSLSFNDYEKGIVILRNMKPENNNVSILINGKCVGDFIQNEKIEIDVYDNDLIEIDGTKYNTKSVIKIIGVSTNLYSPKLDTIITTSQSIERLGKVQLK